MTGRLTNAGQVVGVTRLRVSHTRPGRGGDQQCQENSRRKRRDSYSDAPPAKPEIVTAPAIDLAETAREAVRSLEAALRALRRAREHRSDVKAELAHARRLLRRLESSSAPVVRDAQAVPELGTTEPGGAALAAEPEAHETTAHAEQGPHDDLRETEAQQGTSTLGHADGRTHLPDRPVPAKGGKSNRWGDR